MWHRQIETARERHHPAARDAQALANRAARRRLWADRSTTAPAHLALTARIRGSHEHALSEQDRRAFARIVDDADGGAAWLRGLDGDSYELDGNCVGTAHQSSRS